MCTHVDLDFTLLTASVIASYPITREWLFSCVRAFVIIVAALQIGTVSAPLPITAEAICFIGVDVMCAHVLFEVALPTASVTTSYPIT